MSHRDHQFGNVVLRPIILFAALLCVLAICTLGCKTDRREVERLSVWLCERHLLEKPDEAMLIPGERLEERLAADDWSFLQKEKEAEGAEDDPFVAVGKAFGAALEPSAQAMATAIRSHTTCAVEILSIEGDRAKTKVTQEMPHIEEVDFGVFDLLGELASLDGQEQRVEAAKSWLNSIEGRIEEKHELDLVKEGGAWRIEYGLAARARAEERAALKSRLDELRAHREELEAEKAERDQAREALSAFEVKKARFYKRQSRYRSQPVIDLTVRNGTEHAVARAFFSGVVSSPGRSVPWIEEDFNYRIRGGLEPGEEARWRLRPNMFSEWGTDVPPDAKLEVEVVRLDGADGEALYSIQDRDDTWDFGRRLERGAGTPDTIEGVDARIADIKAELSRLGG